MYKSLYNIACLAYSLILRTLILKAINDPNSDMDEVAMGILDKIFNYQQK